MKFDCFGRNECENDGQCFQDSPVCPRRSICVCSLCHYGSRCQFTTSEFGLSLDAILAYYIIPDANIFHQTPIVKLSFSLTIVFIILGLINGTLSFVTFKNKRVLTVGCGIYLLSLSIITICTMILFGLKYFIYLSSQITIPSNISFLRMQCSSLDFLLQVCLHMDQWLTACIAIERVMTVIRGVHFEKDKSKTWAKKILIILLIAVMLTSLHDPLHRRLFEEQDNDNKRRIWCIVSYSPKMQTYNRIINTLHFFIPFLVNLISSIILITKKSHHHSSLQHPCSRRKTLCRQFAEHRHLLAAPVILFFLGLPRLFLSYVSKCMNSAKDSWMFLCGYFISFIPPMITFLIFVLPSKFYREEWRKSIRWRPNHIFPN
ncbi:unnamed protein product [Adineta ricciae]|uniref:G-protein coupled receptors family 1 profile domain-containing protein n=1 Tax=Adineta ricciae TaxID=249248 RepID=A0A815QSD8_ADIRI|nr:unnamed protein product [Adineta ricciae]